MKLNNWLKNLCDTKPRRRTTNRENSLGNCSAEVLEERRVLTVITGTNGADLIEIGNMGNGVMVNGEFIENPSELVIDARGGNDEIRIGPDVNVPIRVLGGPGNDEIFLRTDGYEFHASKSAAVTITDSKIESSEHAGIRHDSVETIEVWGTEGNDTLNASQFRGNAVLKGMQGDDFLIGGHGNDRLWGGDGEDTLIGGLGHDRLHGEQGSDVLFGDLGFRFRGQVYGLNTSLDGNDVLFGGDGDDRLHGGNGINFQIGGEGADEIFTGDRIDIVFTDADDTIRRRGGFVFQA